MSVHCPDKRGKAQPVRECYRCRQGCFADIDARKAKVVELRYFGGLTVEQTAEALRVSPETVMRDWRFARSWLRRELSA